MSAPDSHYDVAVLRSHHGFNKKHVIGGYPRQIVDPKTRLVIGMRPRNPSRWMPHQGKQECERRRRRIG